MVETLSPCPFDYYNFYDLMCCAICDRVHVLGSPAADFNVTGLADLLTYENNIKINHR